jgi:hypothetical protein
MISKDNERRMNITGWHRRPELDDEQHMAWAISRDRIARINQITGEVLITVMENPCPN